MSVPPLFGFRSDPTNLMDAVIGIPSTMNRSPTLAIEQRRSSSSRSVRRGKVIQKLQMTSSSDRSICDTTSSHRQSTNINGNLLPEYKCSAVSTSAVTTCGSDMMIFSLSFLSKSERSCWNASGKSRAKVAPYRRLAASACSILSAWFTLTTAPTTPASPYMARRDRSTLRAFESASAGPALATRSSFWCMLAPLSEERSAIRAEL